MIQPNDMGDAFGPGASLQSPISAAPPIAAPAAAHGDERAAFEAKFGKHQKWCDREVVAQLDQPLCETLVGKYVLKDIQKAWEGWQSGRQSQAEVMRLAMDALERCYDVTEWPASGNTPQDKAAAALRSALATIPSSKQHQE